MFILLFIVLRRQYLGSAVWTVCYSCNARGPTTGPPPTLTETWAAENGRMDYSFACILIISLVQSHRSVADLERRDCSRSQ